MSYLFIITFLVFPLAILALAKINQSDILGQIIVSNVHTFLFLGWFNQILLILHTTMIAYEKRCPP